MADAAEARDSPAPSDDGAEVKPSESTAEATASTAPVEDPSEEDKQLLAEIAALEERLHDLDVEHAAAVEDAHARDNAEQRLAAVVAARDEAASAAKDARAAAEAMEARAADRTGMEAKYGELRAAEDRAGAEDSETAALWNAVLEETDNEELLARQAEDGMTVQDVTQRLDKAVNDVAGHLKRAAQMRDDAERAAAEDTSAADGDAVVQRARAALEAELQVMDKLRATLRRSISEQHFHLRRGTHLKTRTITKRPKDEYLELDNVRRDYDRLCSLITEEEYALKNAKRALEETKREGKRTLRTAADEKAALQSNVDELVASLEEVDWEHVSLTKENEELRKMRHNVIQTQSTARLHASGKTA